ncbi:hypothetical protein Tco_0858072 [Tanacetum coccineum]|uniref:Retrovirus-related Pol polyprotein from transposon TNT 1-94-like beta-barrel domain-containing protein n=1 Tax=Tanacetum coccineum TaxID=301880 RepID=A0ABQ5B856_9ASTR
MEVTDTFRDPNNSFVLDDILSRQKLSQDKEGLEFPKNEKTTSVCLKCDLLPDDSIMDIGCTKHMTGNRRLFTSYKAYDGGHVVSGSNIKARSSVELQCVCHWADPFKDLKWSNVPGVKLSSLSESDDTFSSLKALSNLYYLFSGFMDYLWSRELDISNFGLAYRKILPMIMDISTLCRETISFIYNLVRVSILSVALVGMKCADLEYLVVSDGNESYNRNLRAIIANEVVSCSTLSDQGYAKDFYDQ